MADLLEELRHIAAGRTVGDDGRICPACGRISSGFFHLVTGERMPPDGIAVCIRCGHTFFVMGGKAVKAEPKVLREHSGRDRLQAAHDEIVRHLIG